MPALQKHPGLMDNDVHRIGRFSTALEIHRCCPKLSTLCPAEARTLRDAVRELSGQKLDAIMVPEGADV
jgi:hypothetical protein